MVQEWRGGKDDEGQTSGGISQNAEQQCEPGSPERETIKLKCVETVLHFNLLLFLQLVTCPNASFTDLAEIVSRIEPVKPALVDGKSMLNLISLPFKSTFGSSFQGFWNTFPAY